MDINKLLNNVSNLNQYISTTQDASEKCKNSKIQLNMTTVLALKKIRSLEIEYFSKCEENGIACVIFERMLSLPPSKTWGVLGKELVILLQYWLDALRKHLVKHNLHWWSFLQLLMRFLQEIRTKDVSLPNTLVEYTTECLLDLATNDRPDALQRQQILNCLNTVCSESSRELRFALRNGFAGYFIKLSAYMCGCGFLPCQYSILETLLRWLLPRQDRTLRLAAAAKWFPHTLYSEAVASVFLERTWVNFFQDARDLLNAHNSASDLITSVVCKRLAVGNVVIITGTEKQDAWLDINLPGRCMSVLLDPRVLEAFGSTNHKTFDTLVISDEITQCAKLYRQDKRLMISVSTLRPPRTMTSLIAADDSRDVTIAVTSHNMKRLDAALRSIFGDKYQILLDVEKEMSLSPIEEDSNDKSSSQEDPRFSHPVETKRRVRSGYVVKQCQPAGWKSPSTTSTTSLALLHDKLAALPHYRYDKKPVSVCAQPDLSVVSEHSETDDRLSYRYKPYGVYYRRRCTPSKSPTRKSQSDGENKIVNRLLSPGVSDKNAPSCLLVATIGSADDSIINDTVERLAKRKDYNPDNIVDLLVQEALEASIHKDEIIDSGINTGDRRTENVSGNGEIVENTPDLEEARNKVQENIQVDEGNIKNKPTKVLDTTSTDESNTEYVNDTPVNFVNVRSRKKSRNEVNLTEKKTFDVHMVEEFFSQHYIENKTNEGIVSPTLAKKINETSTESSDFDDNFNLMKEVINENCDFNNIDVIECLNSIVDRVCDEFDKCTEYLNKDDEIATAETSFENKPLQDIINTIQDMESKKETKKRGRPKSKNIKLKYKTTPRKIVEPKKSRIQQRKNKLGLETTSKMSTIIEDNSIKETNENDNYVIEMPEDANRNNYEIIEVINENNNITEVRDVVGKNYDDIEVINEAIDINNIDTRKSITDLNKETSTPLLRRKRKLYSPKDDLIEKRILISETEEDDTALSEFKLKKPPKSKATCYKEIERDRQKHIRMPRKRKFKGYEDSPSPRTKKRNDIFDKLKETSEGEKVTLADKTFNLEVYNFTSDSEDEDFKTKMNLRKLNSTTTVGSVESARSTKRRVVNRSEDKPETKRRVTRRKKTKTKIIEPVNDLVDERMREAKDVLNTSIGVHTTTNKINGPDLVLDNPPTMELIDDDEKPKNVPQKKKNTKKIKVEPAVPKKAKNKLILQDDRSESPLPGLVVETIPENNGDVDLSANLVDKFKKIYRDGPESYVNETNTTQNLLNTTNNTTNINITEEINQIDDAIDTNDITSNKITTRSTSRCNNPKTDTDSDTNKRSKRIMSSRRSTIAANNLSKVISDSDTNNKRSKRITRTRSSIGVITISEVKSEASIATQGITAHGDFDESPPKLLEEDIQHRDIEDLDQSIKDYFNELTEGICQSNNGSNDSNIKSQKRAAKSPILPMKRLASNESRNSKNKVQSEKSCSPVVSLKKLSPEDISRWLPSRRTSDTDSSKTNTSVNRSKFKKKSSDESDNNSKKKSLSTDKFKKSLENRVPEPTSNKKKSKRPMISPIKLFDDLISNSNNESVGVSLSDDEEYMREIKRTISKNDLKIQKSCEKRVTRSKSLQTEHSSNNTHISTSTRKLEGSKRVLTEERVVTKKVDLKEVVDLSSASAAVSSMSGWFKRNEPASSKDVIVNASVKDTVENILEKLDTTLVEIQQNTSSKFVHMFVNAQRYLSELKQVHRNTCKVVAADILAEVVKVVDTKFAELDKKSQEANDDFMKQLREQASKLISEDSEHKRVMVRLLREDVQAVLDHLSMQQP